MAEQRGHEHHASALRAAAVLTLGFALFEAAGGWWTGSLALLSDAGHMLTDGAALALAAAAAWMARRPPSARHSYGLGRAGVFVALVNALAMFSIAGVIGYEALARWQAPPPVKGGAAALIAAAGLVLNLAILRRLTPHRHELNTRAAILHVAGDALGSAAALASGLLIAFTGWLRVDPIASAAISVLIGVSALRLTRESVHALMEGVPRGLSGGDRPRDGRRGRGAVGARPACVDALGQPHRAFRARRGGEPARVGPHPRRAAAAPAGQVRHRSTSPCSPNRALARWCATARLGESGTDHVFCGSA